MLKTAVVANEQEIVNALGNDLRKPLMEAYTSEIGMVINEINFAIKNLRKWVKPVKAKSSLLVFPAKSYTIAEPFGMAGAVSTILWPMHLIIICLLEERGPAV